MAIAVQSRGGVEIVFLSPAHKRRLINIYGHLDCSVVALTLLFNGQLAFQTGVTNTREIGNFGLWKKKRGH